MMEKPGMTVSRWIDGVLEKNDADRPGPEPAGNVLLGPRAELADPRRGDERAMEKLDLLVVDRPVSVGDGGDGAMVRKDGCLPAAGVHAVRDLRLGDGVEPLAPVAREGDRAAVRVANRPHDHGRVRGEVRLRQGARQELKMVQGQGRHDGADAGVDPAGDQPRHLDHRLHRPDARAPEGAHAQHGDLRREDAARQAAGRATATTSACRGRATARPS